MDKQAKIAIGVVAGLGLLWALRPSSRGGGGGGGGSGPSPSPYMRPKTSGISTRAVRASGIEMRARLEVASIGRPTTPVVGVSGAPLMQEFNNASGYKVLLFDRLDGRPALKIHGQAVDLYKKLGGPAVLGYPRTDQFWSRFWNNGYAQVEHCARPAYCRVLRQEFDNGWWEWREADRGWQVSVNGRGTIYNSSYRGGPAAPSEDFTTQLWDLVKEHGGTIAGAAVAGFIIVGSGVAIVASGGALAPFIPAVATGAAGAYSTVKGGVDLGTSTADALAR